MDTDNDNERLNLPSNSSRSSSNNSSSSNVLMVNLPLLPLFQASDNNGGGMESEQELQLEQPQLPLQQALALEDDLRVEAENLSQPQPPPPPSPPPLAIEPLGAASQSLSDNSIFVSPLLFNNNTTPPPSSSSKSSSSTSSSPSPASSSHNLQFYHNQQIEQDQQQQLQLQQDQIHSLHALHFEHSPSPPSLQQHALLLPPPPPSSSLSLEQQQQSQNENVVQLQQEVLAISSSSQQGENQLQLLEQDLEASRQQQQQTQQSAYNNDNITIADTIDASAIDLLTIDEANEFNDDITIAGQQEQQHTDSLNVAQTSSQSCIISDHTAGESSSSSERNQTPPTSLPLLLQEEEDNDATDDDEENAVEGENANAAIPDVAVSSNELNINTGGIGSGTVRAPKSSSHLTSTHHPLTHPLQHHHHHHHHYYPNFGVCSSSSGSNNTPFAFDIPAFSGGEGGGGNGSGSGGSSTSSGGGGVSVGVNFISHLNPSNGANTIISQSIDMLGNNSNSGNLSGGSASATPGGGGVGGGSSSSHHHHHHHNSHQQQVTDRLKMLYPNVNESENPLPRCWSPHDKCLSIGLSQNNLRVHYKGIGNKHNDAASVRTAHPIPPACGLYYFEVKIISKGKNGYMGIGLTASQFRANRLPGWDKQSYGYHGDDGNSFSSSGNGQSYGPTFTTGDIIGCCVNFVDNTCFYTKNGIDLGIAFRDLPNKLYPTVGLQTPGEEVDANFGQEPFKFDQIEDMMKQMRAQMKAAIYDFPMSTDQGDPTTLLHKMVSSYLLHTGYSQTAEAFARSTGQTFQEDMSSIRNRQKILKLVLSGKMGKAIELTIRSYPGLLENNSNLWFMLKCRQFVEMVNGSDIEYCPTNNKLTNSITKQTQTTPPNQTSVIQSTKSYQNGKSTVTNNNAQSMVTAATEATTNSTVINVDNHAHQQDMKNASTSDENCSGDAISISNKNNNTNIDYMNDVEMETNVHATNGNSCKNGSANFNSSIEADEEMDIDVPSTQKYSQGIERILEFGKELSQMGQQLEKENKMNDEDRQMLEDAFSLIAYSNPWSSPLGWQLCPTKRENVCTALNSAILESMNYPRRPPLDICVAHASELLKVMAQASLGACAFVNIEDIFPQN